MAEHRKYVFAREGDLLIDQCRWRPAQSNNHLIGVVIPFFDDDFIEVLRFHEQIWYVRLDQGANTRVILRLGRMTHHLRTLQRLCVEDVVPCYNSECEIEISWVCRP